MIEPFEIRTARLILDQPRETDVDDIATYCGDPAFEWAMVTPWPYERQHAEYFVGDHAPGGWARDDEWTWAIREHEDGPLLGAVGVRFERPDLGYWLGAPHRGRRIMPEAVRAVADAVFARRDIDHLHWECRLGNTASARGAEQAGFAYLGAGTGTIPHRDGTTGPAWLGRLERGDDASPKPGWPRA